MIRRALILVGAALAGCQEQPIYERPLPDIKDIEALRDIRDGLPDADQDAWGAIMMAKVNPMASPVRSKTVGEAIAKMKAKRACMETNSMKPEPDDTLSINDPGYDASQTAWREAYNRKVHAYNACLKMPV